MDVSTTTPSKAKQSVILAMNSLAEEREKWIRKNNYYYDDLAEFFNFCISKNASVLEIGCGSGVILDRVKPKRGVGIDISGAMIKEARKKFPEFEFMEMDAENLNLEEKFDYVLISDSLGYFEDIQKAFHELNKVVDTQTRLIITYHNFLWQPVLKLAESLKLKMPQKRLNWLNKDDIANLLEVENFEIIKTGRRFLFPKKIPLISKLINKYLAPLPLFNLFCLTGFIIARPKSLGRNEYSVSVVVPARNEKGNIEKIVLRTPQMGKSTELIFIEGGSSDGTYEEIERICQKYSGQKTLVCARQEGTGKGDAVRKGFSLATGEILMILDADMTVPPEALPKFYEAIAGGKGEFINGSRLVYPMEKEAMRTLNMMGNKFFSLMFSWLLGQRLKDTLCGTKVISKTNYQKLIAGRKYFGEFDPFGDFDLIFGAAKLNLKIVEIPIKYMAREYGETNISRFRHGWLLLKMVFFAMNKIKFI